MIQCCVNCRQIGVIMLRQRKCLYKGISAWIDILLFVRKTLPPSFHPGRHVNMLFCLHDFREGTVNRETGCLTLAPTRFFFNVCFFTHTHTLGHATWNIFPKRFCFRFTRYCEVTKLPIQSRSPLLQKPFLCPLHSPARSRQDLCSHGEEKLKANSP